MSSSILLKQSSCTEVHFGSLGLTYAWLTSYLCCTNRNRKGNTRTNNNSRTDGRHWSFNNQRRRSIRTTCRKLGGPVRKNVSLCQLMHESSLSMSWSRHFTLTRGYRARSTNWATLALAKDKWSRSCSQRKCLPSMRQQMIEVMERSGLEVCFIRNRLLNATTQHKR